MRAQRNQVIDFTAAMRKRDSRVARRLLLETMRIRRPIPRIPHLGVAAALLAETRDGMTFWARPDLDDIDLKIVAYAFALRFPRFDRGDAIRLRTLRVARAYVDRQPDPEGFVDYYLGLTPA